MHKTGDWQPAASIENLKLRAKIIRRIREWFYQNNILEVETPQLAIGATTDPNIDSFTVSDRHLRTSAEFHHKRLLCAGSPDIYELGKVFRVDESGRYHNPEFTMLEWYRLAHDHLQLVSNVESLLQYLHDDLSLKIERISYRELWKQRTRLDIAHASCADIASCLQNSGVSVPDSISTEFDKLQDLAMGTVIADGLMKNQYTCVYDYPASQASLAKINSVDSEWPVASRFEIYFGSVELANGFHELTDPVEQLQRFEADNIARSQDNKMNMPIDMSLIDALQHGLPDCAGVAIGIDRLMMVLLPNVDSMQQVISFDWQRA